MTDSESMVRTGFISDVRVSDHTAQVCFPDMDNMVSDWLPYLRHPRRQVNVSIGSGGEDAHSHSASASVSEWVPAVNDTVLVLMEYGFNSKGYILGVIS